MDKTCASCKTTFIIDDNEHEFLKKFTPTFNSIKFDLPLPKICPKCRLQLRTMHRNEQYLYHTTSSQSGKPLISLYSNDTPWGKNYKIMSNEEWWSDQFDPLEYGRDFDFNQPFFEQFYELSKNVPHLNLITAYNENCPYTTGTGYCKNCYLINSSENCENCYYGKLFQTCKDVADSSYVYNSELIYECFYVRNCYNCAYLSYSQNCTDCFFSENLKGCRNCFLCANLNNKENYIRNKATSKEEFQKIIQEYLGSFEKIEKIKQELNKIRQERIHKYATIVNCEGCIGDFIINSKNCIDCYDMNDSQDCRYVTVGVNVKDLLDCSNMYLKPELCYQVLGTIEIYNVLFSLYVFHSQNVLYSEFCYNCKDLFGCSGLRRKQYCIFNKQYTKEEYEKLVPKIIAHMQKTEEWGKFFPYELSPYGYNDTLASEYFPLSRDEVINRGWRWHDEENQMDKYMGPSYTIPDKTSEVQEEIIGKILVCQESGKPYKIISQELEFYKKMNIPIPRLCPDIRYKNRLKMRNPRQLYDRDCAKCKKAIKSTYASNRPEIIYCEECYLKEVY